MRRLAHFKEHSLLFQMTRDATVTNTYRPPSPVPLVSTGHRHRSHRSPPVTVTDPIGPHRPPSPIPSVPTGHRHRSHRSPPATVTGPTGLHRPPSSVPPVFTGHRHRSPISPVFIGLRRQGTSQCHYGIESIGIVGIDFD